MPGKRSCLEAVTLYRGLLHETACTTRILQTRMNLAVELVAEREIIRETQRVPALVENVPDQFGRQASVFVAPLLEGADADVLFQPVPGAAGENLLLDAASELLPCCRVDDDTWSFGR